MDDNAKNAASYQIDQEVLDARGIKMTVEEVAGLSTCKYSERVASLKLKDDDLAFLKGLRRRIKNRLASQNSRRRSVEHIRKLARELRAVRECRDDLLQERRMLVTQRDQFRDRCVTLRTHIMQKLQERSDNTEVPSIDIKRVKIEFEDEIPPKTPSQTNSSPQEHFTETQKFECRIEKLVQQSVNHIFKNDEKKKVFAKTVFIANEKLSSDIKCMVLEEGGFNSVLEGDEGVLNLSLKEGRRKSHGRKQLAPRRVTCVYDNEDGVLDLKIKKESQ